MAKPVHHRHSLADIASEVIHQIREEHASEPHRKLREHIPAESDGHDYHCHIPGFKRVGKTGMYRTRRTTFGANGVIYVMSRASELGFSYENEEWANLGQGAPETTALEGAPERPESVPMNPFNMEYASAAGLKELREAVAKLYNHRYRKGKESQYTYENVCIVPGGRAGLTHLAASLGEVNVGYFLPDYTAYEQMLTVFKSFSPIPTPLKRKQKYHIDPEGVKREIKNRGLSAVLTSNPGNPTGQLLEGADLERLVDIGRKYHCSLLMDEFYSGYIYTNTEEQTGRTVSSAEYVKDVNVDPVVIIDGLTKNWRLPGWRVCWVIGPKEIIDGVASAASFLDGGPNHPLQEAAVPLLDPEYAHKDTVVLQRVFKKKRDFVLERLQAIGISITAKPDATFYIWANVENLPAPLNNGLSFFEEALKEKVIVVPGIFFDINPGKRRELFHSPYHHYLRISCGPPMETLVKGMDLLEKLVNKYKK